ncbi:hypothetical protein KFU94_60640 [Chloroflexi bacterium TSY]|nr:hypothetical protein [Chloroflexi bacterium TSY]
MLDQIAALVDKSLVRQMDDVETGCCRFTILESFREFGLHQLQFAKLLS